MRFNKLDLNLLVALNALLAERNITRAAEQLHITQSAMSNALGRLREYFEDELLVPVGRRLDLTPRARSLEASVREVLMRIDTTISAAPEFDPARSDREFTLFVSDFTMATLLPHVQRLASQQHSRVRLRLRPQIGDLTRVVERGEMDLLIAPRPFCSREHPVQELLDIEFVSVSWRDSEIAQTPLSSEVYRDALHATMKLPDDGVHTAFESWFTERYGIACRVGLTTYSYAVLPLLVVGTELVATVPRQLAELLLPSAPIVIRPLPEPALTLKQAMQWHQRRSDDPGLVWLRALVAQAAAEMTATQPAG